MKASVRASASRACVGVIGDDFPLAELDFLKKRDPNYDSLIDANFIYEARQLPGALKADVSFLQKERSGQFCKKKSRGST